MRKLKGKIAIITGGGQGIGLGIARAFAKEGAKILVTGRNADKLKNAVKELEILDAKADYFVGTAGKREDAKSTIAKAIETFGGVDILVNNAQTSSPGTPFEEHDDFTIAMTVESGFYGTFQLMQEALESMKARGGGSIINFGSREGVFGGVGFAAYSATKEAIRGLSRTAARELGKHKIRVNVICPAALSPIAVKYLAEHPAEAEMYRKEIALGYFGDPEVDIGSVAVFLASNDSQYVTGQTINADGGQMML